jgi:hypothetical protein
MLKEFIDDVFIERSVLVKQENIARKNNKVGSWLKLLSMHRENHNW